MLAHVVVSPMESFGKVPAKAGYVEQLLRSQYKWGFHLKDTKWQVSASRADKSNPMPWKWEIKLFSGSLDAHSRPFPCVNRDPYKELPSSILHQGPLSASWQFNHRTPTLSFRTLQSSTLQFRFSWKFSATNTEMVCQMTAHLTAILVHLVLS